MLRAGHSFILLAFCLSAFAAPNAVATIIGAEVTKCPRCAKPYVMEAIVSWNYTLSGGMEPPRPSGICPHCLYAWQGEVPTALSQAEKRRIEQASANARSRLAPGSRRRLVKTLGDPGSSDEEILSAWLVQLCQAARAGSDGQAAPLRFRHGTRPLSSDQEKQRGKLKSLLPTMVGAQRAGRPVVLPKGSGDREMHVLYLTADLITQGNRLAAEYFLRWVTAAEGEKIDRCKHAIRRNLQALAVTGFDWPHVIFESARVPLIGACLAYIRDQSPMPETIRRQLTARGWNALSDIAVEACALRGDRSAATLLGRRLSKRSDERINDSLAAYYRRVGTLTDVPALTRYAARMSSNKTGKALEWPATERLEIEGAIRVIRLKNLVKAS